MTELFPLKKIVIIGLGLIGGSLAMTIRAAGLAERVFGVDADPATLEEAARMGVVTDTGNDLSIALQGADLVVLATPIGAMRYLMGRMINYLAPGTILTDCGSTKTEVIRWAQKQLGGRAARFVAGHPIAGSEASGLEAASPGLFRDAHAILCPTPETAPEALACVAELWRACGAQVHLMSPGEHDAVFAAVSHLPQLLAFSLMHAIAHRPDAELLMERAGSGFRSFTRLAGSHPVVWRDICLTNRAALLRELRGFQMELETVAGILEADDAEALQGLFSKARQGRATLLALTEAQP